MTSTTHPPQFQPAHEHRIKFATGVNFVWILRYTDSQPWTLNSIIVGTIILMCSVGSGVASRAS